MPGEVITTIICAVSCDKEYKELYMLLLVVGLRQKNKEKKKDSLH